MANAHSRQRIEISLVFFKLDDVMKEPIKTFLPLCSCVAIVIQNQEKSNKTSS